MPGMGTSTRQAGVHDEADGRLSYDTLSSVPWKRPFTPSGSRADAERISRAVCLWPSTAAQGFVSRGWGGAAESRVSMHALSGLTDPTPMMEMEFAQMAPRPGPVRIHAMAHAMMGRPEIDAAAHDGNRIVPGHAKMQLRVNDQQEDLDAGQVNDIMAEPQVLHAKRQRAIRFPDSPPPQAAMLAPDVVDDAVTVDATPIPAPARQDPAQRIYAHQVRKRAGLANPRTDFAKTLAFGGVAAQSGYASFVFGLPDSVGRYRVEVDVISHPALDPKTLASNNAVHLNRGSATLAHGDATKLGAFTGYFRTAKPLSLAVAPLPVIGSEDLYMLPVVATLDPSVGQDSSVHFHASMGPYAAPTDVGASQRVLGVSGQRLSSAWLEWSVLSRPPIDPSLPSTVASDDPNARFEAQATATFGAGVSGRRLFVGLQGLLPRPDRPEADIEQQPTAEHAAMHRHTFEHGGAKPAQWTPVDSRENVLRLTACRDCNPLNMSGDMRGALGSAATLDSWEGSVRVEPVGYLREYHSSGMVSSAEPADITVPLPAMDEIVPGSMRAVFSLYPSPAATLGAALESLLQQPHGCFEQSSATVYPLAMALHYFKMHRDTPRRIVEKATGLLEEGYRKLTTFECKQHPGGFEWFGCQGSFTLPHEALTAFGALEFLDMSSVWTGVDPALLSRVRSFLLSRRDGRGGFQRESRSIDSFGRAPPHVTDAYILWSMLAPAASELASGSRPSHDQRRIATELQRELQHANDRLGQQVDDQSDNKYCRGRSSGTSLLRGTKSPTAPATYGDDPYYAALVALANLHASRFLDGDASVGIRMAIRLLGAQRTSCQQGA